MLATVVNGIVRLCTRFPWPIIVLALLGAFGSAVYAARHFAINTDINKLISSELDWRKREAEFEKTFPGHYGSTLVIVDAPTAEYASRAAADLAAQLKAKPQLFRSIDDIGGSEFFARNGLLYRSTDDVASFAKGLGQAAPLIGTLVGDPSLRGLTRTLSLGLIGVQNKMITLDALTRPLSMASTTLENVLAGRPASFSWQAMVSGQQPASSDLRRLIEVHPVLDFSALQPGAASSGAIRQAASDLQLAQKYQARVRLTGSVPMADEEFATVRHGALTNAIATIVIVLTILWLALKSARLIVAVFITLFVGLAITAALGLMMVGALNMISVAFAVLFVGLGVDFGIQFSVRYRAERHDKPELLPALDQAAEKIGVPLTLAAAAVAAGFLSFLPTDYRGVSELGEIAGTGMIVAFATTVTLLPALLAVFKPPGEPEPIGYAALAPIDRFLETQRKWVVGTTLAVTILGLPLLTDLRFDFNPLDLRSRDSESVATLLDLMADPDTSPNTLDILEGNATSASTLAERLRQLGEVAQVVTLQSFVPKKQEEKLAIIDDASFFLRNTLDPDQMEPKPTPADTLAAIETTAHDLRSAAADSDNSPAAVQTRRLGDVLAALATQPQAKREEAERVLVLPLVTTLRQVRSLLTAEHVTVETLPQSVTRRWVSAEGLNRLEVAPSGDGNDNETLERFVAAVRDVAPDAAGKPVFVIEAAATIVKAFIQAAIWSVASIALILFIVLRRWSHVALTLVPLLVAIVVTLEICVLIGLQLNFANIIALPLLLGVGVAFKIYYIVAWWAGERNFLQSSLTRAVIYSACTTATAFGSLWFSHHPGTSSMGKLMALCLVTTLAAAVLFQPALLATQNKASGSK